MILVIITRNNSFATPCHISSEQKQLFQGNDNDWVLDKEFIFVKNQYLCQINFIQPLRVKTIS